jgi:hypothetical protein
MTEFQLMQIDSSFRSFSYRFIIKVCVEVLLYLMQLIYVMNRNKELKYLEYG